MKMGLNYIGQLRIYSLVDLLLLLVAIGASRAEFVGVFFLHVGLLALLEGMHSHNGRAIVPKWAWIPLAVTGVLLYGRIESIFFLTASFFYTKKTSRNWGMWSPFFRGSQMFFLLAGICGYGNALPWIAFLVFIIRNFVGDLRDVEKDAKSGMRTLPLICGMKKDLKYGHLVAITVSTSIWWSFSGLNVYSLLGVILVEVATYNLTPR